MKRPYQITGVLTILLAAFVARESLDLTLYTRLGPGPGFLALLASVLTGLVGGVILYQATFRQSDPMPPAFFPSPAGYLRIGAIILAVAGVVALMNLLGFRLTMLAFLVFLLSALGRQNPIVTALVALAGSFGTYHTFVDLLAIPLPVGVLGF